MFMRKCWTHPYGGGHTELLLLFELSCYRPPSSLRVGGGVCWLVGPWDFRDSPESEIPLFLFYLTSAWTLTLACQLEFSLQWLVTWGKCPAAAAVRTTSTGEQTGDDDGRWVIASDVNFLTMSRAAIGSAGDSRDVTGDNDKRDILELLKLSYIVVRTGIGTGQIMVICWIVRRNLKLFNSI